MHIVIKMFISGQRRAAGEQLSQKHRFLKEEQQKQKRECQASWSKQCDSMSRLTLITTVLLGLILIITPVTCTEDISPPKDDNITAMERLRLQLFTNYDKNIQPTHNDLPTNITLALSILYIDIDEISGKMTMHAWLKIHWYDDKRTWKKSEYDNITQIHLKPREVWRPDITLFNSAGDSSNFMGDSQILLYEDGDFHWVPPVVYTTYCSLNLRLWPYDKQSCKVKIGSWSLTYIDEKSSKYHVDYEDYAESTEWEITDFDSASFQKQYFNYMEYTIMLQRRSSMYSAVIFTPASCIVVLALSAFWLPPQMGEKILLNGVIIVVIAAFLMYFAQLLPILAHNTPLVVLFYSASLLMLSIATIISVTVLYLSTASHKRRVPEFIRRQLNGMFGKVLLISYFSLEAEPQSFVGNGNPKAQELGEHVYDSPVDTDIIADAASINAGIMEQPTNRSIQFDWILLATAVDRIAFIIFSITFIVLAIAYYV